MLQRKLFLVLGSLICLTLIGGAISILTVHSVLEHLIDADTEAAETLTAVTAVEAAGFDVAMAVHTAPTIGSVDRVAVPGPLDTFVERLGSDRLPEEIGAIRQRLLELTGSLRDQLTTDEPRSADTSATIVDQIHAEITMLRTATQARIEQQQERLVRRLRLSGLLVGVVFLVLLNGSIFIVLRAAVMVLRPIDSLVVATRHLGREQFEHRVHLDRADEFGELAGAFNGLAERLQTNEERRIQILHQVARTLNHELNNAINVIDLQITVLRRSHSADGSLKDTLEVMRGKLAGMTQTIASLKRVNRIVLTDYSDGTPMLDLERSVEDDGSVRPSQRTS